jgi:protein-tyrosine phosphatase
METSSYFIENKAIFGNYPDEQKFNELLKEGVKYFIDLTTSNEKTKLKQYSKEDITYINYEVKDRYIPENIFEFTKFLHKLKLIYINLKEGEKIYVHCKGGHGRAGIVVSCLLCYLLNYTPEEALKLTNIYHNNRKVMKDKWREIGSPQTDRQKEFVKRLFKPIYLDNINIKNTYYPINNNYNYNMTIDGVQYKNLNVYYYSMKDKRFYNKLNNSKHYHEFKQIVASIKKNNICNKEYDIIKRIYKLKYDHNVEVQTILKKTLLKPIKYIEDGINMGNVWEKIREEKIYN